MSARLSRAEIAVLLDELEDFLDDGDIDQMLPEYAYNLGVVRAAVRAISIAVNG